MNGRQPERREIGVTQRHFSPLQQSSKGPQQRGAVLIVSLVMLTILTVIAVGTATDIGFQMNMARNNQISLQAFNVSLSELKAQFKASEDNDPLNGLPYLQRLSDVYQRNNTYNLEDADLLMAAADNPFEQQVILSFIREGNCGGGGQVGSNATSGGGAALIFEIQSTSNLDNTGINSDQSFGVCYPNPSAQ